MIPRYDDALGEALGHSRLIHLKRSVYRPRSHRIAIDPFLGGKEIALSESVFEVKDAEGARYHP